MHKKGRVLRVKKYVVYHRGWSKCIEVEAYYDPARFGIEMEPTKRGEKAITEALKELKTFYRLYGPNKETGYDQS
jgi:hypothetical protein